MKLEIWQVPPEQAFSIFPADYKRDADWTRVWASTLEIEGLPEPDESHPATSTEALLEQLFAHFQRIDPDHMPPPGYHGRSLTSGDLVRLGDEWWFCAILGWHKVDPPDARRKLMRGGQDEIAVAADAWRLPTEEGKT
jgi:hypothetical protein